MVLWMILRECILLLVLGLSIGIPVALSSTRILKSLLYELSPRPDGHLHRSRHSYGNDDCRRVVTRMARYQDRLHVGPARRITRESSREVQASISPPRVFASHRRRLLLESPSAVSGAPIFSG
jgi:hypothetical protein